MSIRDLRNTPSVVMILLVVLFHITSSESPNHYDINDTDVYKAFLTVLNASKKLQQVQESDKIVHDQKYTESPYERFVRNLRTNWVMPVNYLQERGYLKNSEIPFDRTNNDLSMDASNLINGPLMNPFTSKNVYPLPHGPNSLRSSALERTDRDLYE